jgi:hypothetical protein
MSKSKKVFKRKTRGTRRRKSIKSRTRKTRKMRGGDFSTSDRNQLNNLGFSNSDIQILEENGINNINLINSSLQQINPQTGIQFTPQEIIQSINVTNNNEGDDFDYDYGDERTQSTMDTEPIGGRRRNRKYK